MKKNDTCVSRTRGKAKIWAEPVTMPTYGVGDPNPNPMFLEKRVYQGSSGVVYPYPLVERVDDAPHEREWTAVFLENDYVQVMVLPELGGRVQMAKDKTNGCQFVYYNRVIKPALVGLTGPWISGGIEFNWPQHHRPTTDKPVDWEIEENSGNGDGSVTLWCSEHERMFRTRSRHGLTLHPDRAYLRIDVRLYNASAEPQTFLWWANPAVHVNDEYQSVFPPDVHAVMDHGKRDVSSFPIATGTYYKKDYSPGTDISRYSTIPVPTSYMAYHSDYDFVGCYDHRTNAGMLHVANHHLVPGKKQWTWGDGDFGRAWDRQLTDEDGPYIELMCGAFTDNQPDFSWLMPGEEKRFTQVFMPYKDIGMVRNATADCLVSLDVEGDEAQLGVYLTRPGAATVELWRDLTPAPRFHNHKNMVLTSVRRPLTASAEQLFTAECKIDPAGDAWRESVALPAGIKPEELFLRVRAEEKILVEYTPPSRDNKPDIPSPATPAEAPADIASNEELFLNGQHLEQYRHATYAPEPYYEEAIRRDPGDSRCNNALGLLLLRRGQFAKAEPYFRTAIDRLTLRNPNPYDGEPYYNLGLSLRLQGRFEEAFDVFYKAVWSEAWKAPALFELARLASRRGDRDQALALVDQCLDHNGVHQQARWLQQVLRGAGGNLSLESSQSQPNAPYNALECGLDALHAGMFKLADQFFAHASSGEFMAKYYQAWSAQQWEDKDTAKAILAEAAAQDFTFAFPNQLECVPALQAALQLSPDDALAAYALGNFWCAHRQYDEAIDCWEKCTEAKPAFPTAWRNLGLAYMNKRNDAAAAERALTTAFQADRSDARVLFELDQLRKKINLLPEKRLKLLDENREQVLARDDLAVEYTALLNLCGRPAEALELLSTRSFQPWEGGEGKTTGQYMRSVLILGGQALQSGDTRKALELMNRADKFPENLGEGKLEMAHLNHVHYHLGCGYEAADEPNHAAQHFRVAAQGSSDPTSAMYYNDQLPEMIYFQGLALRKLGQNVEAETIFQKLVTYGETHENDKVQMDYFAVSLPNFLVFDDDLSIRNRIHCRFMILLGQLGLGDERAARESEDAIISLQADHPAVLLMPR